MDDELLTLAATTGVMGDWPDIATKIGDLDADDLLALARIKLGSFGKRPSPDRLRTVIRFLTEAAVRQATDHPFTEGVSLTKLLREHGFTANQTAALKAASAIPGVFESVDALSGRDLIQVQRIAKAALSSNSAPA